MEVPTQDPDGSDLVSLGVKLESLPFVWEVLGMAQSGPSEALCGHFTA